MAAGVGGRGHFGGSRGGGGCGGIGRCGEGRPEQPAQERAQVIFWITVLGGVGNAIANWVLIFGKWGFPELGITGAAIATLINHCLMLAGLCFYALRTLPEHTLPK